jgi:hypothetical protein
MSALGTVFGFAVASREPIPGLNGCAVDAAAPVLNVNVELGRDPDPVNGRELLRRNASDGRLMAAVSCDGEGTYRLYGAGFGAYDVAADASEITCRPPRGSESWVWQRFLMSQALPLAATLRGVEPFHASGVVIGGRVVAISGPSGVGKSSLTLSLAARGLPFFTDDVLAVAATPDGVICKAGPGAANVRDVKLRERIAQGLPPFGAVLGDTPDGIRALVTRDGRDRPMGAFYFLDHSAAHAGARFERTHDPRLVLGHTFNVLVQTEVRLAGQLELCAQIAEQIPLFRALVPRGTPVGELASEVERHARSVLI